MALMLTLEMHYVNANQDINIGNHLVSVYTDVITAML